MSDERQRLDRWLFFARIIKSRTLAQKLITGGKVRVDAIKVTGADHRVGPGMVLTLTAGERLRILKILDLGTRRGPAPEAQKLYEDMSPALLPPKRDIFSPRPIFRPVGAGRPTKKQRRETDRFTGREHS